MRTTAVAFSTLLLAAGLSSAGAPAAMAQGYSGDPVPAASRMPSAVIQLAESNTKSANKLADKYLAGKAGGRYGIGGTESVVFKKKKKK